MDTLYVNKRSELTTLLNQYSASGYTVYRTRCACGCTAKANIRQAIICINSTTMVHEVTALRCRGCVNRKIMEGNVC